MKDLAPIILFTYNRPVHTRMCIESLKRNTEAASSDLYVYSDGPRTPADEAGVREVRKYIHSLSGFRSVTVREADRNRGLAESVIKGVTEVIAERGRMIAVEDDLILSPYFLRFMNEALTLFQDERRVGNVHGHLSRMHGLPDTFLIYHGDSWGWGTWKRAWDLFESDGKKLLTELKQRGLCSVFDFAGSYPYTRMLEKQIRGENNSWAIRWKATLLIRGLLSVNAGHSLVANNGFDASGTNCGAGELIPTDIYNAPVRCFRPDTIEECAEARRKFTLMYRIYNSKLHKAWVMAKYKILKR